MVATAWIALAALVFTAVQAWIALRKLRLDLFAKRFEAWEAMNDALNDRLRAAPDLDLSRPLDDHQEILRRIWRQQRLMRALFPIDVSNCLLRIEKAFIARDVAQMEMTATRRVILYAPVEEVKARTTALTEADRECRQAQDELAELVHRYIRQYGWIELAAVEIRRRLAIWRAARLD